VQTKVTALQGLRGRAREDSNLRPADSKSLRAWLTRVKRQLPQALSATRGALKTPLFEKVGDKTATTLGRRRAMRIDLCRSALAVSLSGYRGRTLPHVLSTSELRSWYWEASPAPDTGTLHVCQPQFPRVREAEDTPRTACVDRWVSRWQQ